MRLWHYELIPVLPKAQLVSQWRECIAIKRQWEKGTLKHRLVSYVMNHDKGYFYNYVYLVRKEMKSRQIKISSKYYIEIYNFCESDMHYDDDWNYPEHDNKYLIQCFFNLQEKHDRRNNQRRRLDSYFTKI